ncbi:MAG: NAD(P)/FAD-dependent oxidoreductase [Lachnospiraceae bacterium]|nr:NAD(P)/FAD-dependent oxidoreductase [Lachnospiraceae bacterium]
MGRIIVIGAGAAGMMAAYGAALNGNDVTVYEKNEKCGKKLYITGKGRCNLTNSCEPEEFFDGVVSNRKFMYSPFYALTNYDTMDLFSDTLGLELKIERGNRVFPASDKSSDVIRALSGKLNDMGVRIRLGEKVTGLIIENGKICGVNCDGRECCADAVIVATGGLSYPSTGSTGDGYDFARYAGHSVTRLSPALVPLETGQDWVTKLQGLSLKNVRVTFTLDGKNLYSDFGEMIFTHYGVSGPVILTAASHIGGRVSAGGRIELSIDLKPALDFEQLARRIDRDFEKHSNGQFKNSLGKLLPAKLIPVIVEMSGISPEKKANSVTREERNRLAAILKNLSCTIIGLRGYNEAIITRGGVNVKEMNPSTMESRKCKGLYFAGEVLDVDAVTGGYNLQVAWSTGYLAGISAGQ